MFYSHTFLARKSPLGMIWIAAHLEGKLKRSQIESVNISLVAEKVILPDVPIALRLSGHLLFGLIRIYSWKVNHLFSDCNRLLSYIRKAYASVPVDLPMEADHAPFESVTLPDTFDLKALELDESYYRTNEPDMHVKSYDKITMTDNFPMEAEEYVAVSVSEDGLLNLSTQPLTGLNPSPNPANVVVSTPQRGYLSSVTRQLEDDMLPAFESGIESALTHQEYTIFSGITPSENETDKTTLDGNNTFLETSDIENMRDPDSSSQSFDAPGDVSTGQQSTQAINKRQSLSTIPEDTPVPDGGSSHFVKQMFDTFINDPNIPELEAEIHAPVINQEPAPVKRQKAKKRKHVHAFDRQVVLTNMQMKNQLSNTSNIICKRKKLPCSDLDVWKLQIFSKNDNVFHFSLLSKMDTSLVKIFERTYPCSVPDNINFETPVQVVGHASPTIDAFSDFERARDAENIQDVIPQFIAVNFSGSASEPPKENIPESHSDPLTATTPVDLVPPNPETPPFHLNQYNLEDAEVPGLLDSASQDLNFLNEDCSSSVSNDAFLVGNLSTRTRAVAKYLKDNAFEAHSDKSGHVSLNKVLDRKNRKQCARMFFETLVLKSCNYIQVEQKEAYGEILIAPTPALFSTKF